MEVVRDVTDVGIRLQVVIPASWWEVPVEGAVLVVGGRLEDSDQTMLPTLQVRVQTADNADSAAAAVSGVASVLRDAAVVFERSGTDMAGYPETVAEIAHRSDVLNATQISMFRTIYLPRNGIAVSAVATCGGGASEPARDELRYIAMSMTVGEIPGDPLEVLP